MLQLSFLEFFLRGIPEAFLIIFAIYTFSKAPIGKKNFIITSLILSFLGLINKMFPVNYAMHFILTIIEIIILSVNFIKIDLIKSIHISLIIVIIQFICEGANVAFIQYSLRLDMKHIFTDAKLKIIYGIPSLIIFAGIVTGYYIRVMRRKEL